MSARIGYGNEEPEKESALDEEVVFGIMVCRIGGLTA